MTKKRMMEEQDKLYFNFIHFHHGSLLNSLSVCRQSWDELRFYRDYQKSQTHAFRGNNSEWSQVPRKPQSWFCPDFLSACRPSWDESGCNLILVKMTMMSWSAISFYDLNIMVQMTLNMIFKLCLCAGKVGWCRMQPSPGEDDDEKPKFDLPPNFVIFS